MAVVLETTLGDLTIDLYIKQRPKACLNFLKLCKIKYYNFNLFHTVNQNFIAQTGDPTGSRNGGESIWGVMAGLEKRYFEAENTPRIKHTNTGLISFVGDKDCMIASQFFITLADDLSYLDAQHCVFGEVTEGLEVLRNLNEAICDTDHRPYQDIRITHTVVLEDPFPDPENLSVPDGSPEPTVERLQGGRIAPDEDIDETEGKSAQQVLEIIAEKEAKARATILEMIGDIPDAEMAPPENVLFVCKLNPVTNDDDLEIIFSRFGKIKSCEVIRDKKTGDSLQYAFVEFEERKSCEDAYFKMDNVLIDDRRIHVDFSQSVAKVKWNGKGRGVTHFNDRGEKEKNDPKNDVGNGRYRSVKKENDNRKEKYENRKEEYEDRKDRRDDYDRKDNYDNRSRERKEYDRSRDRRENGRDNYYNKQNQNKDRYNYHTYKQDKRNYNKPDTYRSRNEDYYAREQRNLNPDRSRNYSRTEKYDYRSDRKKTDVKTERRQKYEENSDNERSLERNKTKNKYKETKKRDSSEDSSVEEVPLKKTKKSKKKKSKKKKKCNTDDESSESSSESDNKKSRKKKKKKSKKQESSEDSTSSSSEKDMPQKKSRKR